MSGGERVKITEDVRKIAAKQKIWEAQALQLGLEQKGKDFVDKGAGVYAKAEAVTSRADNHGAHESVH